MKKPINYKIKDSQKRKSYKIAKNKPAVSRKINGNFCSKSGQCKNIICEKYFCEFDKRNYFGTIKENYIF